jgi:hypothetical protein
MLADTETGATPSGGRHFIYEGEHKFSQGKLGRDPDLPSDQSSNVDCPNYFMIPGQGGYKLIKDIPAMQAPPTLQARVKPPRPLLNREPTGPAIPLDVFRRMLKATTYSGGPAGLDDRHTYNGWLNFLFAAHDAAGGDEGDYLEAVIEWSLADPNQDWDKPTSRELVEDKWRSITDGDAMSGMPITRGTWIEYLKQTGNGELAAQAAASRTTAEDDFAADPMSDDDIGPEEVQPEPAPTYEDEKPFPEPLSLKQLIEGKWPLPSYTVEGLVMQGVVNTFNADGGTGKTTVSTQFGTAVSEGKEIFGRRTIKAPVLLVLSEDGEGVTQARVKAQMKISGVSPEAPLHVWCLPGEDVALAKISDQGIIKELPFLKRLDDRMAKIGKGVFVVLDSLVDVVQMDMSLPAPANAFFKRLLTGLCQKHSATFLVLAHPSKASMADGSWSHGTLAMKNAVRNAIAMRKIGGQQYRELWSLKHNYGGDDTMKLYFELPIFTTTPPTASTNPVVRRDATILAFVLGLIKEGKVNVTRSNNSGGMTPRNVADALNKSNTLPGDVRWQDVQAVMIAAERTDVIKYVRGYGKTDAHYEWLGEADADEERAAPQPGDFDYDDGDGKATLQ